MAAGVRLSLEQSGEGETLRLQGRLAAFQELNALFEELDESALGLEEGDDDAEMDA